MTSRHEALAKSLRRRRTATISISVGLVAVVVGAVAWVGLVAPALAERQEFTQARDDFQRTWCETYGVDPTQPGVQEWQAYIDRNREFLNENYYQLGIVSTGLDGQQTFELGLEMNLRESGQNRIRGEAGFLVEEAESYWFGSGWFPIHFDFFRFGDGWSVPPSCEG
jgi:hypothetical protein